MPRSQTGPETGLEMYASHGHVSESGSGPEPVYMPGTFSGHVPGGGWQRRLRRGGAGTSAGSSHRIDCLSQLDEWLPGPEYDLNMTRTRIPAQVRNMPGDVTVTGVHFQAYFRSPEARLERPLSDRFLAHGKVP